MRIRYYISDPDSAQQRTLRITATDLQSAGGQRSIFGLPLRLQAVREDIQTTGR